MNNQAKFILTIGFYFGICLWIACIPVMIYGFHNVNNRLDCVQVKLLKEQKCKNQ